MNTRLTRLMIVTLATLALASVASAQNFVATIDGGQVPTGSSATGTGIFSLDASKMLSFEITFSGLGSSEIGAHIHGPAAPNSNAGIVFPLPLGEPKIGMVGPLTAQQEADLNAGLYYVNIHTTNFPGGEIRGQILQSSVPNESSSWSKVKGLYESR